MSEIIQSINEINSDFDGYRIKTTEQVIEIGISNSQSCCERWGYLVLDDADTQYFIGAELHQISLVNEGREKYAISDINIDEGGIMFIDIETSKGVIQIAVYNAHNGYYGHRVFVTSKQLQHEDWL